MGPFGERSDAMENKRGREISLVDCFKLHPAGEPTATTSSLSALMVD